MIQAEEQQKWKSTVLITGLIAAISELFVIIRLVEQIFSTPIWTLHQATTCLGLLTASLFVPLQWVVVRKRCENLGELTTKSSEATGHAPDLMAVRGAMSTILTTSCGAVFVVVLAFTR
jgi:hypothetical protein